MTVREPSPHPSPPPGAYRMEGRPEDDGVTNHLPKMIHDTHQAFTEKWIDARTDHILMC